MKHRGTEAGGGRERSSNDPDPFRSPLDFIARDHLNFRAMCAEIDRMMAADTTTETDRRRVRDFLVRDLPLLLSDEDEDLFPLMLARAEPDDEMPRLQHRLERDHSQVLALVPDVLAAFAQDRAGGPADARCSGAVQDFTGHLCRHLILETAVLMPLARLRLTKADLAELGRSMRRRRGGT